MRLYYLIILFFLVNIFALKSQVGINTQSPQGVLHIDPKGDTVGATNSSDDFIITSAGRVGIGTVSPAASLDIVGDLRIADGTEYDRYVMTSDASGVGAWKRQTYTSRVVGIVPATLTSLKSSNNIMDPSFWVYTGANITLPAGSWMIYYYCVYNNPSALNYTVWWDLGTTTNWATAVRVGRVLSYFAPTTGLSPTYASYGVSPTVTTTYYMLGTVTNPAVAGYTFTYNSGARIWAIPVF